jgi:DNA-binding NtrC family response regulator
VRSIVADILCDAGYEVAKASSAAAALDALAHGDERAELILVDIAMPGVNGVELAEIVRRTWPTLPVLLMTGYADSALLCENSDLEILKKPFQAAELEEKLQLAVDRTRMKRV